MANRFLSNITINDAYTFPSADGTNGQVIGTDGAGNLSFIDQGTEALTLNVTVKNVSGGSLAKGTIVHAHPSANPPSGNLVEVIAADYDDATKMPAIGVLNETLANEAEGQAIMFGAVSGIDTSSFSAGDELWVGNNGAFTNTKPATAGQLIQKIAVVIKSHASNGLIKIFGAGRTNDVPLPLHIDNANQNVGIGVTPNSSYKLDVSGDTRISGTLEADSSFKLDDVHILGVGAIGLNRDTSNGNIYNSNYSAFQLQHNRSIDAFELQAYNGSGTFQDRLVFTNSGRLGIGTFTPEAKLQVEGSLKVVGGIYVQNSTDHGAVLVPEGGYYKAPSSPSTGAIKITLPTHGTADMIGFTVDIYDYQVDESITVFIKGYLYQTTGNNEWVHPSAQIIASKTDREYNVRFGSDGSNHCVWIGETNSSWSWLQVQVRDFFGGFSTDIDAYDNGWSVSVVNTFGTDTIDEIITDTFPQARNADTVDGLQASQFLRSDTNSTINGAFTVNGGTGNAVINVNASGDSFVEKDNGNHLYFANNAQDKNIYFRVNDGGTYTNALTINGSTTNVDFTGTITATGAVINGNITSNGLLKLRGNTSANNFLQRLGAGGGSGNYSTLDIVKIADTDSDFMFMAYHAGIGSTTSSPKIIFGHYAPTPTDGHVMTIDTKDERVGIGTSSPEQNLHISSNVSTGLLLESTYGTTGKQWLINSRGADSSFQIYNETDAVDALRIRANGDVGIGTASPIGKFNIRQSTLDLPSLFLSRYNADDNPLLQIGESTHFSGDAGYGEALIHSFNRDIVFSTQATEAILADVTDTPALIIEKGNGNIGIGLNDPGAKLDVNGDVWVRNGSALFTDTLAGYSSGLISVNANTNFTIPSGALTVSGGLSVLREIENSAIGGASTPADSPGWYKLAKIDTRGGGIFHLSFTGGSWTPTTYEIKYFKNWTDVTALKLEKYGDSGFITEARIRLDSSDSKYYLEIYCGSYAQGLSFSVYHNRLLGYNATTTVYTGPLASGSASGTTYAQLAFTNGGTTVSNILAGQFVKSGGTSSQFLKADGSVDSNSYALSSHSHQQLSGFANQAEYDVITSGNFNGLRMKARWDGATADRYWDMGYVDGFGTFYSGLKVVNNGDLLYKDNTVWHAGNDGSTSGLDADLLDGIHATGFFRDLGDTGTVTDFDNLAVGINHSDETTATNQPYANHNITLTFDNDASAGRKAQIYMNDTALGGIWFRPNQGGSTGWHDWSRLWGSYDFTSTDISNWNTAFGWGDHADAGYLSSYTETDTLDSVADRGNSTNQELITSSHFSSSNSLAVRDYTTDARIHLGNASGGASGVFAGRRLTDAGGLRYGTYWAYDCYWDDTAQEWNANRTTLGKKWKAEMGYHLNEFAVYNFDGTVSSGWADSSWNKRFSVDFSGNITASGTVNGTSFVKSGGTSSQFLKANGSVDSTEYFPKTGGTITGSTTVQGNLAIGGSDSQNYISFRGTTGDQPGNFNHTYIGERVWGGTEQSELLLFKGNDPAAASGPDRIRHIGSEHIFQTYSGVALSGSFADIGASTVPQTAVQIYNNKDVRFFDGDIQLKRTHIQADLGTWYQDIQFLDEAERIGARIRSARTAWTNAPMNLEFQTGGLGTTTTRLRIDSDGMINADKALSIRGSGVDATELTYFNLPTEASVNLGTFGDYGFIDIASEHATYGGWIDFSKANGTDYAGRIRYRNDTERMVFHVNGSSTPVVEFGSTNTTMISSLTVTDSSTGIYLDSAGHASVRIDRGSTSFDNNILFLTAGVLDWRIWQDGSSDYLYVRDEGLGNVVTFKKGGDVGIGVGTSVEGRLDVAGSLVNGTQAPDWSGNGISYNNYGDLTIEHRHGATKNSNWGFSGPNIDFRSSNTTNTWSVAQIMGTTDALGAGNHAGGLMFMTSPGGSTDPTGRRNQGSAPQVRMAIGGNGQVVIRSSLAIGKDTVPNEALDIVGNITTTGNVLVGGTSSLRYPASDRFVNVQSTTDGAIVGYNLTVIEGTNNRRGSFFLDDSAGVYGVDHTYSSGSMDFVMRTAGSEVFRFSSTGYFGIMDSTPDARFTLRGAGVSDASTTFGAILDRGTKIAWTNNGQGTTGEYIYSQSGSPYSVTIHSGAYNAIACPNTSHVYINHEAGTCSIGSTSFSTSYKLYVTGSIYATGDVIAYSDKRKKENIVTIDNALDKVKNLRGVYYNKTDDENKERNLGVIAQEVLEVLPEAVSYAEDKDEYGVKYGNIVGVLIEAIKEQQKQIDELKAIINKK